MKVFISWSGEISRRFALALRDWLPSVIQQLKPFVSSEDIEKGTIWFGEIGEKLGKEYQFGILCLTPLNHNEPWILFEAGALFKGLPDKTRVTPLLLGLKNADLKGPLSQFHTTLANREDIKRLLVTLNGLLGDNKLNDKTLEITFEKFWPDIDKAITDAQEEIKGELKTDKSKVAKRNQDEIVEEILETARNIYQLISKKENVVYLSSASNLGPNWSSSWPIPSSSGLSSLKLGVGLTQEEYEKILKNALENKGDDEDKK